MTPAPSIVPIFASPFAEVSLPGCAELNPALVTLFSERATEEYREAELPRDPRCFRSREDLFEWDSEPIRRLRGEMLTGICSAVMAVNLYTVAEFDALKLQARARFIIVRPDGCVPATSAPMASWYALYCVAAPPPTTARTDSALLRLYTRSGTMFMDAANWRLRPPFPTAHHHHWRPVPGQMAVFPASLLHEVALNRTDGSLLLVGARVRFAHPWQEGTPPW
jgi:hypothetical protein